MVADGHIVTSQNHDDSHGLIGICGVPLEPNSCEHCSYCGEKVVQGIECDFECDEACVEHMMAGWEAAVEYQNSEREVR